MDTSRRYSAVVVASTIAGEEVVLAGRLASNPRKFLHDFGGFVSEEETPAKSAVRNLERGLLGLLGTTKTLIKQVTVKNRFRVPVLGYVWRVNVPAGMAKILLDQFQSVRQHICARYNDGPEPEFAKIEWVLTKQVLHGSRRKFSPELINIVRHMSFSSSQPTPPASACSSAASSMPSSPRADECEDEEEELPLQDGTASPL